ncbi:MAG: transcriptional regulator NrdR [Dehalococcoidia bacterium]
MRCPHCGESDSAITDTTVSESGIRRQRECQRCHREFATLEQLLRTTVIVVKRDGRREDFQRDKLLHGLRVASRKRPLPAGALEAMVEDIETRLAASGRNEVLSRVIGEMAITHLKRLDPIAYIRFSSAYRQFVSLDDMMDELAQMAAVPLPPAEQPRLFSDDLDRIAHGGDEPRGETRSSATRTALPRVPTPIEAGRAGAALSG